VSRSAHTHDLATQPGLPFDAGASKSTAPRRKRKRHHDSNEASRAALETGKERFSELEIAILRLLAQHDSEPSRCLTAREILRALVAQGVLSRSAERNSVSPRLSRLLELGCIENPADSKRRTADGFPHVFLKRVSGDAAASVWKITERGRLYLSQREREAKE